MRLSTDLVIEGNVTTLLNIKLNDEVNVKLKNVAELGR